MATNNQVVDRESYFDDDLDWEYEYEYSDSTEDENSISESLLREQCTQSITATMQRWNCDAQTAQRYQDLLSEGYTRYQAQLMAGLIDPSC